jgi:iron complex outermembrane receptor protein
VNYIARSADTGDFDAAIQTSVGSTSHSNDMNYAVKGMVNVPLIEDKLAVRVVGLERLDAGYVDNIRLNNGDSNELSTRGGRLSAVFVPTEATRLSWLTMYQETDLDDQSYVTIPTLTRETYVPEPHQTEMLINSLRLDQELGFGNLTVLGAIADKESTLIFDYTGNYGESFMGGGPVFGVGEAESKSRNIEVRLSSAGDGFIEWVVGAMYLESEKDSVDSMRQVGIQAFLNSQGQPGSVLAPGDDFDRYVVARDDEETALFGEVTFNFSDAWALTAGGRLFDAKSDNGIVRLPGLNIPAGASFNQSTSDDGFTPKLSVSWRPDRNLMLYATYSEGFRVGGANPNPPGTVTDARSYDSDSVTNYELGVRSTLAGGALQLDAAAFHIKWDDIQVRLFGPAPTYYSYVTNAGGAENDGVEFTGTVRAGEVFEFQTAVTYIDAQVSSFVPDTFAPGGGYAKGTRLPGSSEWTISNSVALAFDDVRFSPHVLLMHRYLSEAPVAFGSAFEKGDYHIVDARVGLTFSRAVDVSLFANNLLDEYGTLNAPFASSASPLGSVTRPRTIGLTMNWSFR